MKLIYSNKDKNENYIINKIKVILRGMVVSALSLIIAITIFETFDLVMTFIGDNLGQDAVQYTILFMLISFGTIVWNW